MEVTERKDMVEGTKVAVWYVISFLNCDLCTNFGFISVSGYVSKQPYSQGYEQEEYGYDQGNNFLVSRTFLFT